MDDTANDPDFIPARPRRPASLTGQPPAPLSSETYPGRATEFATEVAEALLAVGSSDPQAAIARADQLGIAELTDLWQHAEPDTAAGTLWVLHIVRSWCTLSGSDVADAFRAGSSDLAVDVAISGLPDDPDASDMAAWAQQVLTAAYGGSLDLAADRAAALLRVVAGGWARQDTGSWQLRQASRASSTAERLTLAARHFRAGRQAG